MRSNLLRAALVLLVALVLCTSLASCQGSADDQIPENMQYATVQGSYYRLFVPVGWNLMTDMGISGAYASLQNVAVVYVRDYDALGMSAAEYAEHIHAPYITSTFPQDKVTLAAPEATLLGGQAAVYVDYTGTRELVTYQGRDVICVLGGRAYVLTFCAQKAIYADYTQVRDEVTASFIFHDAPFVPEKSVNTVDTGAASPAGMKPASNDDVAYRLYVPEHWVLDTALPTSSAYVSESDRSGVTVTVYLPEVDQMSAEQYWEMATGQIKTALPDMSMLSTTSTELDGRPAHTYVYTATVGQTLYRFAQTVASYRGMVYTVTYTARDAAFDQHIQEYNDILAAFDFRGND